MKNKIKAVKEVKSFGHLSLNSKDFPEVKDLKIGTPIQILVTLSVESLRAPDRWEVANGHAKPSDITAGGSISKIEFPKKEVKK